MGYTHYWSVGRQIHQDTWASSCRDTEKLVHAFRSPVDVEITDDLIRVNGSDNTGCEDMGLVRNPTEFQCCKTGHMPYDKLVCAILCVASDETAALHVWSDACMGSIPDGWPAAARWASRVLGREVRTPWKYSTAAHVRRLWRTAVNEVALIGWRRKVRRWVAQSAPRCGS